MKILVLTPSNSHYMAYCMEIWEKLDKDIQSIGFCIPMYMQYLIETKQAKGLSEAYFYSMKAAEIVYERNNKKDLIIFGNTSKDFDFDVVFSLDEKNFRDLFVESLNEIIDEDNTFLKHFTSNLHKPEESILALEGAERTAKFLNTYLHTKVQDELDKLIFNYNKKIKEAEMPLTQKAKEVV